MQKNEWFFVLFARFSSLLGFLLVLEIVSFFDEKSRGKVSDRICHLSTTLRMGSLKVWVDVNELTTYFRFRMYLKELHE